MITKGEYQVIQGRISDLAWDADSQRIIAVGDGKEKYGHCFTADSGNTVGSIVGHSAVVNAVSIRPVRPYRAATVGDDGKLVFYQGPPFQFSLSHQDKHNNFVQDVQFSPNGEYIISVGSDRKIALYEGKSGEFLGFIDNDHKGSIFSVAWSADSTKVATSSADQSVKLWDVASKKLLKTWTFATGLDNHQVGVVFAGDYIISLSYSGNLNYLQETSDKPIKTVTGHQKSVTTLTSIGLQKPVVSGSYDGKIIQWDENNISSNKSIQGHSGLVVGIVSDGEKLWSVGWDDTLKLVGTDSFASLAGQPRAIASDPTTGLVAVVGESFIQVFKDGHQIAINEALDFSAQAIAINSSVIAVGSTDNSIYLFNPDLTPSTISLDPLRSAVTYLSFSPNGEYLAAGDAAGKITLFSVPDQTIVTGRWAFHTSRVSSISWHPSGQHVVSGSADTNIIIYSVVNPSRNIKYLNTHKDGVNSVHWTSETTFASAGSDATIKHWSVTL